MEQAEKDQKLHDLELLISHVLRVGVLLSGGCLLVGWIGMWFEHGSLLTSLQHYHAEPLLEKIQWAVLMQDRFTLLSLLGLLILVTLPLVRVLMTGFLFLKQKDFKLGLMAFLVFGALVASFFLGIDL